MIDIKLFRDDPDSVKSALSRRRTDLSIDDIISLDEKNRQFSKKAESLNQLRNKTSEEAGRLKKEGKDIAHLQKEMEKVKEDIKDIEREKEQISPKLNKLLLYVPNILEDSVPDGQSEKDNKLLREESKKIDPDFNAVPHWEIGERLGILDFKRAVKLSGARFVMLSGMGSALERALINFMVDFHVEKHGYREVWPPFMVTPESMRGTGQLPKFEDELFKCKEDELFLIPTAEVPITNMHRDEVLAESELPIKYVSYTACFRREAGSYGKDTKGLIRNHQFNKVELLKFAHPDNSRDELEKLLEDAAAVLEALGIPYRVMELCSADVGFSSAKTYDLEVWMPGEKKWREISSCSLFTDFQARRLNIKYRDKKKKLKFVHTLNGSGVAVGRAMAAILENYQTGDGEVIVPDVLRRYLNFEKIS